MSSAGAAAQRLLCCCNRSYHFLLTIFLGRETVQREEAVVTAATVNARRAAASAVASVATSSATVVKEEGTAADAHSAARVATRTTHVAVGTVTIVDHAATIDAATAVATLLRAVRAAAIVDATMIDAAEVPEMREAAHLPIVISAAPAREMSVAHTARVADHRLTDEVDLAASHALATDLEVLVACSKEDQEAMSDPTAVAHTAEGAPPTSTAVAPHLWMREIQSVTMATPRTTTGRTATISQPLTVQLVTTMPLRQLSALTTKVLLWRVQTVKIHQATKTE